MVTKKKAIISKKRFKPITIINFKTYEEAIGDNALKLAKICDEVANEYNANIIIAVSSTDIYRISSQVSIPVYAQHIDNVEFGSHTGKVLASAVRQAGATGTLLNHSENRLRVDVLEESVILAKKYGLKTVVCANDAIVGEAVKSFKPDMVAVEPPELIGGNISVSSAKPEIVRESVKKICDHSKNIVLVGAGIKNNNDFKKSVELGASGILLASGITKAKDPKRVLINLIKDIY
jgi:triosephosphate isomerase